MAGSSQFLQGRVGIAIVGAIIIGGLAASVGAVTAWLPEQLATGSVAQATATSAAEATDTTAITPSATAPQPSPTTVPTAAPTATPTLLGSTIRGTVVSVNVSGNSLVMSRNGTHYTILVDQETQISGAATSLSGIQVGWRVSVTFTSQEDSGYYSNRIFVSIDR